MAQKRRTVKSKGEQLYMLEILVDKVTLNSQVPDINVENLIVHVRFIDLPECEISVPQLNDDSQDDEKSIVNSKYKKSCLFSKTPSCLIRALRWSPLYMDVYHKDVKSPQKSDFLGMTKISLPPCLCKQIADNQKKSNDSCMVKDTFDLIDYSGKESGTITVTLKLSCFGSSIVEQFSLTGKSFTLEDSPLQKFLCPYIYPESLKEEEDPKEEDPHKPILKRPDSPLRIPIEDPAFKTLTMAEKLNDPKYRELIYKAYPDEPTCCCQPKDRSNHPMICPSGCTYPCCIKLRNPDILFNEENKREDPLIDTYCVNNSLSALYKLKQLESSYDMQIPNMESTKENRFNTYCMNTLHFPIEQNHNPCCNPTRLKGGGDVEQIYLDPTSLRWNNYDNEYNLYNEKNNEIRLEGGGGEDKEMSSCSCSGSPVSVPLRKTLSKDNDVVAIFDACVPRPTTTGATPTCICPGKDTKWPRGAAKCMKSPCMGIDCLIRAFKDAQDFVDSIGKVPGLPGLGLMDPSESPYFGRDIDKDYMPVQERPAPKKKGAQAIPTTPTTPTCTAPCSIPTKPPEDIRAHLTSYTHTAPRPVTVPPRLGIVREAIPVLPEGGLTVAPTLKHRKKEDKKEEKSEKQKEIEATSSAVIEAEVGPCGEPRCKSRRKKPSDNSSVILSSTHISAKVRTDKKRSPVSKSKHKSKKEVKYSTKRLGKSKYDNMTDVQKDMSLIASRQQVGGAKMMGRDKRGKMLGPGGDRTVAPHPPIPISRRVTRYVYFVGDFYPGINFGHRDCIDIPMRVPANMGWLWNTMATAGKLKPRIGWRPGAIGRYLYEMLQDAKELTMEELEYEKGKPEIEEKERKPKGKIDRGRIDRGKIDRGKIDRKGVKIMERARSLPSRQKSPMRRPRTGRTISYQSMQKQTKMEGEEEGPEAPPTLHIHRKDGTYYVTMYPIKQETSTEPTLSTPMKPLQFKIVKNKDDDTDATSSTASDMEIEFSPPAAVTRYRKKPDVVHVDTQVRQQEIIDAFKAEEFKKKSRRGVRREKKLKKESKTFVKK